MVLSIYFMSQESSHPLAGKGMICIWDVLVPQHPAHILVADGDVTCACFAEGQICIVVAGSREGNVFAWDLRQAMSARALQVGVFVVSNISQALICMAVFVHFESDRCSAWNPKACSFSFRWDALIRCVHPDPYLLGSDCDTNSVDCTFLTGGLDISIFIVFDYLST